MKKIVKRKIILFVAVGLFFGSILGCDKFNITGKSKKEVQVFPAPAIQGKGIVVARVNNISVGIDDLNDEIEAYNASVPAEHPESKITTKEQKLDYLRNEVVGRLLIYQNALDKGLDRNEEVRQVLEKNKRDLLVMQDIKEIMQNIDVSSEDIENYYNAYKEQLKESEERQISEIVVDTEPEAKDILILLLQGADFAATATQRSRAETAGKGGDLGFIKKGQRGPDLARFDEIAFSRSLEAGQVSNVFKDKKGYYIIKVTGIRGGQVKPLSDLWDQIKKSVLFLKQQQKLKELTDELSKKAKVVIYEDKIK